MPKVSDPVTLEMPENKSSVDILTMQQQQQDLDDEDSDVDVN